MPDLRSYVAGLEREIVAPDLAELERVATARRRVRATTWVAAAVLAIAGFIALVPDGTPGRTLPAVTPTPTATGLAALEALELREIADPSPAIPDMITRADDGHPASIRYAAACLDDATGVLVGTLNGSANCRVVWEVTNGDKRLYLPVDASQRNSAQYLGDGDFVYALWGGAGTKSVIIDADTMTMTPLVEGQRSPSPGAGRHLVGCGFDHLACVVDVRTGHLDLLDRKSLPAWITEIAAKHGHMPIEVVRRGRELLHVLPDGLGRGPRDDSSPLLVSERMPEAVPLTIGPPSLPEAGAAWMPCGEGGTCIVDVEKRTMQQVELPQASEWAHNTIDGFWGLQLAGPTTGPEREGDTIRATAVWVDERGKVSTHMLVDYQLSTDVTIADGGTTGAMTYYDRTSGPTRLHVSTDRGRTWRVLTAPASAGDDVDNGRLSSGWEAWPEVR
ncbi:hypothetical protein LL946_05750 [Knoellia locipacati]|uniref:hypothetical protein n=1 Tax=Knoellia locipacati TaxID=882824 RepID=UPI003850ABF6